MADSEKRVIMIAMDGSSYADYAFECKYRFNHTTILKWLEHIPNHENMFERGVVGAKEC